MTVDVWPPGQSGVVQLWCQAPAEGHTFHHDDGREVSNVCGHVAVAVVAQGQRELALCFSHAAMMLGEARAVRCRDALLLREAAAA